MTRSMPARIALLFLLGVIPCLLMSPWATGPRGNAADRLAETKSERVNENLGRDHLETREAVSRALMERLGEFPFLPSAPRAKVPSGKALEKPDETKVERWIEELGSSQFVTRESALRALMAWEDEPPALRRALKSPDLEVRRRMARILEFYLQKRARRGLAKAQVLAKEGRVDEMVERLVLWGDWDKNDESGKMIAELAARLVEREQRIYGKTDFRPLQPPDKSPLKHVYVTGKLSDDPKRLAKFWQTIPGRVRGEDVVANEYPMMSALVCASGNVSASQNIRALDFQFGIILASGNVNLKGCRQSVIICDGEFEASSIFDCLIIARGKVTCPSEISRCTILSESTVDFPKGVSMKMSAISAGTPNSFVKFFDPKVVGLTVEYQRNPSFGDGVWIKAVRKDTPFAAGLRDEDLITAIDSIKVPSMEIFRKVLRRKLAEGGPILTFTVQRWGKTMDVPIAIKD
jgi:hypothetical protein